MTPDFITNTVSILTNQSIMNLIKAKLLHVYFLALISEKMSFIFVQSILKNPPVCLDLSALVSKFKCHTKLMMRLKKKTKKVFSVSREWGRRAPATVRIKNDYHSPPAAPPETQRLTNRTWGARGVKSVPRDFWSISTNNVKWAGGQGDIY